MTFLAQPPSLTTEVTVAGAAPAGLLPERFEPAYACVISVCKEESTHLFRETMRLPCSCM